MPTQPKRDSQAQDVHQDDRQSTYRTVEKVVVGSGVLAAVIGLLTALVNNGGLDFIKPFMKDKSSSQAPTQTTSPSPSASAPALETSPSPTPSVAIPLAPSPTSSPISSQNSATGTSTENSGFLFENKGCREANEQIICNFLITSQKQDKRLSLYANYGTDSRIIDSNGDEFIARSVQLGSRQSNRYVIAVLAQDIPLKAELSFPKVSPKTNQLALLELSGSGGNSFKAQFRNVPVSR